LLLTFAKVHGDLPTESEIISDYFARVTTDSKISTHALSIYDPPSEETPAVVRAVSYESFHPVNQYRGKDPQLLVIESRPVSPATVSLLLTFLLLPIFKSNQIAESDSGIAFDIADTP
jgi:hypothetical protein